MTRQRIEQHRQALEVYLKKWVRTSAFSDILCNQSISDSDLNEHEEVLRLRDNALSICCEAPSICGEAPSTCIDFEQFTGNLEAGFPERVRRLATEKKVKQIELISLTGIGRSTFYRIMSGETLPSKEYCVEIALSLRLNYTQAQELLESAGYALSRSDKRDMALRYFFVNRIYSIAVINELLEGQHLALICDPE